MARGVILVHGIGEQKRGDFLTGFVGPLVGYLESKGGKVDLEPEIALAFSSEGAPPQVTLKVLGPDGRFAEEWRVVEAYWASAFRPPKLNDVLVWGRRLAQQQARATERLLTNLTNENPTDRCEEARHVQAGVEGQAEGPAGAGEPLPSRTAEFFRNQALLLRWLVRGLGAAAPLLLSMVWLVLQMRRIPRPPAWLLRWHWIASLVSLLSRAGEALANVLYPMLVLSLGDVKRLIDDPISADAMRRSLEDRLIELLADDGIESVSIVAHSLGASVSYDALSAGRRVDRFLRENPVLRHRPGGQGFRRINWVTVGAALNRTYIMTLEGPSEHARRRFEGPLAESIAKPEEAFFWLNLYARYDPVFAGPIEEPLWQALGVTCRQFKERVVINRDSLLADHTSYWENDVLVWPRIVRAICDGQYPWPGTELGEKRNQELIRRFTIETASRYVRLEQQLAPLLFLGVVLLGLAAAVGLLLRYLLWPIAKGVYTVYRMVSYVLFYQPLRWLMGLVRRLSGER